MKKYIVRLTEEERETCRETVRKLRGGHEVVLRTALVVAARDRSGTVGRGRLPYAASIFRTFVWPVPQQGAFDRLFKCALGDLWSHAGLSTSRWRLRGGVTVQCHSMSQFDVIACHSSVPDFRMLSANR